MLQGLNFVMLHVRDFEEARAFYTEKLGLAVVDEQPQFVQFAQPGGQGASFAMGVSAEAQPFGDPELWWYVDDADVAHAALVAKGVEIAAPPVDMPFGRTFAIKDPAGNTLYIMQPRQG